MAVVGTITYNVPQLWDLWQPSQRDQNIRPESVQWHRRQIVQGTPPNAIIIEMIVVTDDAMYIRTADGRHRLHAARAERLATIDVLDTDIARHVKEVFGL